jgi:hypothetical protein
MAETIVLVFLSAIGFWCWMFADCLAYERNAYDKTIWLMIIFMLNIAGAFAYLALRYRTNRQSSLVFELANSRNNSNLPLICPWCDRASSAVKVEAKDSNAVSPIHRICPDCFDKFNKRGVSA